MVHYTDIFRTFYNDRYYKTVCDTELDNRIHLKVDARYIGSHHIYRETFHAKLEDICDSFDYRESLRQSIF